MHKHVLALSTALTIFIFTPAFAQTTTTQQTQTGQLIVPAARLNSAQVMSANDFIGKTVYDRAGNDIGDVNDLIISGDGQIQAVILGVGGFLGMGEKYVAVNTSSVQMVQDGNTTRLVVEASKQALQAAPAYDKSNRRYAIGSGVPADQTGSTTTAPVPAPGATNKAGQVDCTLPVNAANAACQNKTQP